MRSAVSDLIADSPNSRVFNGEFLLAICVIAPMSPELRTNAVLGHLKGFHCYLSCIVRSVLQSRRSASRPEISPEATQTLAGSHRSMGRGIQVAGGQIDKAGQLQIGESGF